MFYCEIHIYIFFYSNDVLRDVSLLVVIFGINLSLNSSIGLILLSQSLQLCHSSLPVTVFYMLEWISQKKKKNLLQYLTFQIRELYTRRDLYKYLSLSRSSKCRRDKMCCKGMKYVF